MPETSRETAYRLLREERLRTLREKCKNMSTEEIVALCTLMKRRTDDLSEELKVLAENIAARDAFDFFGFKASR